MSAWAVLLRRELGSYFISLVGYLVLVMCLFGLGASFAFTLSYIVNMGETERNLIQWYIGGLWFWIMMLVVPPVLTMRLFAEEKSAGTLETLLTAPVTEWQVVLAKYFGAWAFFVILWLPTLAFVGLLRVFGGAGSTPLDAGQLAAGYLGIFLVGGMFVAIGCLASSLTRNQIIAALTAFAVLLLFFMAGLLVFQLRAHGSPWQEALSYLSAIEHMLEFSRGRVDARRLVFYISATTLFLWATKLSLEARKWR